MINTRWPVSLDISIVDLGFTVRAWPNKVKATPLSGLESISAIEGELFLEILYVLRSTARY